MNYLKVNSHCVDFQNLELEKLHEHSQAKEVSSQLRFF